MIKGHGGNIYKMASRLGCSPQDIVDMSSNLNPMGPAPGLFDYLKQSINKINALPEADAGETIKAFSRFHHLPHRNILAGNGTTQFIYMLPLAIGSRKALILGPTYSDYADACSLHGLPYRYLLGDQENNFNLSIQSIDDGLGSADTIFICNPNNPTGTMLPAEALVKLIRRRPEKTFIIDESYLEFLPSGKETSLMAFGLSNVIVLHSMSKIFSVPGLRIGYLVCQGPIFDRIKKFSQPWSLNSLAQAAVNFLMSRSRQTRGFINATKKYLAKEQNAFRRRMAENSSLYLYPSQTPFILARLSPPLTAPALCRELEKSRYLLRNCSNFHGLSPAYFRISLKNSEKNRELSNMLKMYI